MVLSKQIANVNNTNSNSNKVESTLESLSENFALNKEDGLHPTSCKTPIMRFQEKDKSLIEISKKGLKTTTLNSFMGQVRRILSSADTEKL